VSDDRRTGEGGGEQDRTMQVDALVEEVEEGYAGEAAPPEAAAPVEETPFPPAAPMVSARPPPLPKKKSKTGAIVMALVVAAIAIGAAIGVSQVVMGGDPPQPAPQPAVARPTPAPEPATVTPSVEPPASPAEEGPPRQIMLDDEFVIGSEGEGTE
jgi:hypothetical protein